MPMEKMILETEDATGEVIKYISLIEINFITSPVCLLEIFSFLSFNPHYSSIHTIKTFFDVKLK